MAVATLAPNNAGDLTQLTYLIGADTNWQANLTNDGDTSFVGNNATTGTFRDLYNLDTLLAGVGAISNVRVYNVTRKSNTSTSVFSTVIIKTGGTIYEGTEYTPANQSYASHYEDWATNPQSGLDWTVADINALQTGVEVRNVNPTPFTTTYCTQVYVEVTYTPFISKVFIL